MLELLIVLITELYPDAVCIIQDDKVFLDHSPELHGKDMFFIKKMWRMEMGNDHDILIKACSYEHKHVPGIWSLMPIRLLPVGSLYTYSTSP